MIISNETVIRLEILGIFADGDECGLHIGLYMSELVCERRETGHDEGWMGRFRICCREEHSGKSRTHTHRLAAWDLPPGAIAEISLFVWLLIHWRLCDFENIVTWTEAGLALDANRAVNLRLRILIIIWDKVNILDIVIVMDARHCGHYYRTWI